MSQGHIPDHLEPAVRAILLDWVNAVGVEGAWARLLTIVKGDEKLAMEIVAELFGQALPVPDPSPTPAPTPGPVEPSGEWTGIIRRPMCFFDAPAYFWHVIEPAQVRPWLMMMRDAGVTGPEVEFCGPDPVREYIEHRPTSAYDIAAWYQKAFEYWAVWIPILRELGMVANLKFCQSNWSQPGKMADQWWFDLAKQFAQRFGPTNMLVLPVNETDPRVRGSIKSAIQAGLLDGGFQKWQLVGYTNKGDLGFVENHPSGFDKIQAGDHTRLQIPDNGAMIELLYGSNWRQGGTPNTGNIQKYIVTCRQKNTSTGIYSFRREPDVLGLQAVAGALRA